MLKVSVNDRATYNVTKRTYTDEGFLSVPGRVARAGIQQYLASELGLTSRDANDIINVYRPEEEVFNTDSLTSYDSCDVTLGHPSEMVNAKNYNQTSVGLVRGSATRDGDFVLANLIIKSKDAVEAVENGTVQLSAGYTAEYHEEKGVTDSGENYDYVQRNIKINHVAICARARAGAQARLYDNHGVKTMNQVTLDAGRSIEIEDAAIAALVNDSTERFKKQVEDAQTAQGKAEAERDALDEKLKAAEALTTDAAIAARVEAIAVVQDQARKIAGESFKCTSVDTMTIKREALTAVRDSIVWADKNDSYVDAAFDMSFADAEKPVATKSNTNDQLAQLAQDAANVAKVETNPLTRDQAYAQNLYKQSERK